MDSANMAAISATSPTPACFEDSDQNFPENASESLFTAAKDSQFEFME